MILDSLVVFQHHVIKELCNLWVGAPHGNSPPCKFVDHRHCVSGDILFLVVEEQDSTCSRLNQTLLFISV